MSTSCEHVELTAGGAQLAPPVAAGGVRHRGWLIGPWFDALFLANVGWPLLLLWQWHEGFGGRAGVAFWQVYFVTTPHRWITLFVVFLDRERLQERPRTFVGLAVFFTALCGGVYWGTGTLTCLLAVDYIWNAWHFAAQHHGIYRIYGRLGHEGRAPGLAAEKVVMRAFLLYVILRVAGGTWSSPGLEARLLQWDWLVLALPAWLLWRDATGFGEAVPGRRLYLASVCGLYTSLLWAVHTGKPALVLSLATASALFHAIEYLAVVGWSVRSRESRHGERMGALAWMVPRWGLALGLFVVVLGSAGWFIESRMLQVWLFVNVVVAFLHYAYDGLIWRGPRRAGSGG